MLFQCVNAGLGDCGATGLPPKPKSTDLEPSGSGSNKHWNLGEEITMDWHQNKKRPTYASVVRGGELNGKSNSKCTVSTNREKKWCVLTRKSVLLGEKLLASLLTFSL